MTNVQLYYYEIDITELSYTIILIKLDREKNFVK